MSFKGEKIASGQNSSFFTILTAYIVENAKAIKIYARIVPFFRFDSEGFCVKFWSERQHKCATVILALISLFGVYLLVAWAGYSPLDNAWSVSNSLRAETVNKAGIVGAWGMDLLYALLGHLAIVVPLALFIVPIYLILSDRSENFTALKYYLHIGGFLLLLCGLAACVDFIFSGSLTMRGGGAIGGMLLAFFSAFLGDLGSFLAAVICAVIGFYFCSGQVLFGLVTRFFQWVTEDQDKQTRKSEDLNELDEDTQAAFNATVSENADGLPAPDFATKKAEAQTEEDDDELLKPQMPNLAEISPVPNTQSNLTDPSTLVVTRPTIHGLRDSQPVQPTEPQEKPLTVTLDTANAPTITPPPSSFTPSANTFAPEKIIAPAKVAEPELVLPTISLDGAASNAFESEFTPVRTAATAQETFNTVATSSAPTITIELPQNEQIQETKPFSELKTVVQPQPAPHPQTKINEHTPVVQLAENDVAAAQTVEQPAVQAVEIKQEIAKNTYPKGYGDSLIHPLLMSQQTLTKPTTPLPTLDLLEVHQSENRQVTDQEIFETSANIEKALADFKIKASVEDVLVGPVVTRYEIQPAAGIKAARIVSLASDLARSLMFKAIRITDFVPGKPYIGIETPNPYRETVWLRDVLDSYEFSHSKATLPMALGKDISGNPVVVDMSKMPHLLVAGQTGGGKSVGINTMILSLLFKLTPDQVRFIMIDPKVVELSIYNDIPHLLTPVVTDMKKAENALRWAVEEMEHRYKLLSCLHVRNIEGYNEKIRQADEIYGPIPNPLWKPGDTMDQLPPPLEKMSYIVLVVDEFADLMMAAGKQVESYIMRIAQKARAVGIHLILATQRPSTDVITGVIKANIPSRIAFTVASQIDSRTILDTGGAENLLGRGDMLYMEAGKPEIIRVHGAYMTDADVEKVADNWRARSKPNYMDNITANTESDEDGDEQGERRNGEVDPLFDEVVEFVMDTSKVSASGIQRRFSIGYNRAARIVDQMIEQGIVMRNSRGGYELV